MVSLVQTLKSWYGYLPPPVQCESLHSIVRQAGGSLQSVDLEREDPSFFSRIQDSEIRNFFLHKEAPDFIGECIATLDQSLCYGYGAIISPDGRTLARDVTPDFGSDQNSHWIISRGRMLPPPRKIHGSTLIASTNVSTNYYHWLLEEVPRLLGMPLDSYDRVVASNFTRPQQEMIALLRIGADRLLDTKGYRCYRTEKAVIPSIPGRVRGGAHFDEAIPRAATLQKIKSYFDPHLTEPRINSSTHQSLPEKFLISRSAARGRGLVKEKEIESKLKGFGFATVRLEQMGLMEQARLFNGAKVIVAPHGAALANLVFCKPGTRVLELFGRNYLKCMYAHMALKLGLDYIPLVEQGCQSLGESDGTTSIRIEPELIVRHISRL